MNNKILKEKLNKKAFTLVEVMIAILLTTVVLTGIFLIWSKVQQGIARSHTRQQLQAELRNASNLMQNDFKSIKFDEDTFKLDVNDDGKSFSMTFEKFSDNEKGDKLAQDSVEKVSYELNNTMLTRTGEGQKKILSVNCDGVSIQRALDESSLSSGDLESSDEDFKAGREAKLDIAITGKKIVPGNGEEMYHVEKTSVVMRNEYHKKINKTYVSTFDLTKKSTEEVIKAGDATLFTVGGELDDEYLRKLDDEALSGMEASQSEMQKNAEEQLKNLNDAISSTDTDENIFEKMWGFLTDSDGHQFRVLRDKLEDADTEEEAKAVKKELEVFTKDRETEFLSLSTDGASERMTPEEKDIYRKAYDMKVQDRQLSGAYQKAQENAGEGETMEKPTLMIETLKGKTQNDGVMIKNADGTSETISSTKVTEENQKIIDAYEKINLDWMGEFGEENNDVAAYNSAKSLISQADTKIDILHMRQTCEDNIAKIQKAMKEN